MSANLPRRRLLGLAGAGAAGLVVAGGIGYAVRAATDDESAGPDAAGAVDFYGEHQAGIVTPAQDRLHFVSLTSSPTDRDELVGYSDWTAAAARMTGGHDAGPVGAVTGNPEAPPDDTGEALGLPPSQLTITSASARACSAPRTGDRFGIADRLPGRAGRPAALRRRRPAAGDLGGDLVHPGVRERSAGSRARGAQPGADGFRRGQRPLVPAGLWPDLVDQSGPGHAAQPHGVQGRHRQPQARGHRPRQRPACGRAPATDLPGWMAAATS